MMTEIKYAIQYKKNYDKYCTKDILQYLLNCEIRHLYMELRNLLGHTMYTVSRR